MKTVIFIQILYIIINFENLNGDEKYESSIETRAVLISCPEKDTGCEDDDPLSKATQADEYRLLQVKSSDFNRIKADLEKEFPKRVTDCKRKLVITMKLNNKGKIECDDEFIVIDHVYDPITRGKARLLSPVIVKIRQEQMVQLYPLEFQKVVNSNPTENVFTKESCSTYKGCSMDSDNQCCGIETYNGEKIPFSEGFCCSCDSYVNAMREILPDKHENAFRYKDPSLFSHHGNRMTRSGEENSMVVNPNLFKLRAGHRKGIRHVSEEEESQLRKCDENQPQCPPNFFFERDRQIVCTPESLLKELYNTNGKEVDGKEDETCEDEPRPTEVPHLQFKEYSFQSQGNNASAEKESETKKSEKADGNNGNCRKNENSNKSNLDGRKPTDSPEFTAPGSNQKPGLRHSNVLDRKSDRHFTGNQFLAMPLKNGKGEIKIIEIVHGKREIGNSAGAPRHRKKRLTRDNEEDMYFQYASEARRRRNKRILSVGARRMSEPKFEDGMNFDADLCCNTGAPNCTLPVYFFVHDKSILCPSYTANKTSVNADGAAYEDSSVNLDNENNQGNNENEDANERESLEEMPGVPESVLPSPQPEKRVMQLHTNKAGTWDVNTNVRRGNVFTLDLIRNDERDGGQEESEKVEQINYEQKKFIPRYYEDDPKMNERIFQKFKDISDREGPRSSDAGLKKMYVTDKKKDKLINIYDNNEHASKTGSDYYRPEDDKILRTESRQIGLETIRKASKQSGKAKETTRLENGEEFRGHRRKDSKIGKIDENYSEGKGGILWQKSYHPQNKWSGNFRYNSATSGRDNLVDILAYNYPRAIGDDNEYFIGSKNIFFTDSKPVRKSRGRNIETSHDHYYDENRDEINSRSRQSHATRDLNRYDSKGKTACEESDDSGFYTPDAKDRYFEGYQLKNFEDYIPRSRRSHRFNSDFDSVPYVNHQWLGNSQLVRRRGKRSLKAPDQEQKKIKISKWEHRTPPGPEYQFDLSKPRRAERPYVTSSGGGDKQSFGAIQRNFAKLKRKPDENGILEEAKRELRKKMDRERLTRSYETSPTKYRRDVRNVIKGKRHAKLGRRQERGGQDCAEIDATTKATTSASTTSTSPLTRKCDSEESPRESSHCMKLSDLWYSVYLIKRPEVAQLIGVQVYDKQTVCDGTAIWRDITKGYMVRLGSFLQTAEDDVPTISMTFTPTSSDWDGNEMKLDTENYRLLVPSHLMNPKKASFYPEFPGDPSEFMLVKKSEISETGAECNKIGTSFEAFARQTDRCTKPPGSCLNRQPIDLWREDMEARIRGKRGKYFIENFGSVSNTSIKSYTNLTGDYLAMDYYGEFSSVLEIEMRADGNAIVRQGENAQIPMAYIDSMSPKKTKIVLSVMNMGLTSGLFRPRLGECPSNLDPSWCPLEGPLVQIPPQQRHDFKLELSGALPAKKVYCAVDVLNHYNKKVARRRIIIRRGDRCFCAFYCKCICINSSKRSTCIQLSKEDYNAAGYFDVIPQKNEPAGNRIETFWMNVKVVLISMAHALLFLGLMKAILGLFWRRLGIAGIQVIVGPRTLNQYYEREICCFQVVYDECGFPIHPQTCKTVQMVPKWLEMFINFFFFYLYLLKIIWLLIRSISCFQAVSTDMDIFCKAEESEDDGACNPNSASRKYPSNYFAYNMLQMSFTSKKPKSEDNALYMTYKADEDPLEEDDTEFVLEEMKRYKQKLKE